MGHSRTWFRIKISQFFFTQLLRVGYRRCHIWIAGYFPSTFIVTTTHGADDSFFMAYWCMITSCVTSEFMSDQRELRMHMRGIFRIGSLPERTWSAKMADLSSSPIIDLRDFLWSSSKSFMAEYVTVNASRPYRALEST